MSDYEEFVKYIITASDSGNFLGTFPSYFNSEIVVNDFSCERIKCK